MREIDLQERVLFDKLKSNDNFYYIRIFEGFGFVRYSSGNVICCCKDLPLTDHPYRNKKDIENWFLSLPDFLWIQLDESRPADVNWQTSITKYKIKLSIKKVYCNWVDNS